MIKVLLVMSGLGFCLMGIDKYKAKRHQYRIQEKTLWLVSLCFGSVGCLLGMYVFRHKIRKVHFLVGFYILAIAQIACCML